MRRWKTCKQELWGSCTFELAESVFNLLQRNYGVLTFIQQPVTQVKGGCCPAFGPSDGPAQLRHHRRACATELADPPAVVWPLGASTQGQFPPGKLCDRFVARTGAPPLPPSKRPQASVP